MMERLVEQALSELAPLLSGRPEFKTAFNIDPAHFVQQGFLDALDQIVAQAGWPNTRIVLEQPSATPFLT
ncbi:EAL domain-containing protein (putative c-di-GMP-specific phosphodiesterase class I) [Devosia subaequoris]|uniref:EAL domain-containing protein (Putative c-di-GMP-specific phosphodiesterase class I) n=1 Tax=Devosia subaequoris TaxID=395930 RepID=A0A7W6NAW4_9HYPH|nr:EAL domain-containing protein [Devosia subaequoris]MBB4051357.1 EAL domain-containing protein (putative c-di-GMP-specific phosphodiesterase class I) [Devosia subaequoris]MCP1208954.1 EAL domain-containing protein [Devosia subaequoris]